MIRTKQGRVVVPHLENGQEGVVRRVKVVELDDGGDGPDQRAWRCLARPNILSARDIPEA